MTYSICLDKEQAQALVDRINEHLDSAAYHCSKARELIFQLKEFEGWKALGYRNWTECRDTAFIRASAQIDREWQAAKLEIIMGKEVGEIPERVLREIPAAWSPAAELIYQFAEGYAKREGVKLTSGHMKQVVEAIGEAIVTGAFTDDENEQHPVLGRIDLDIQNRLLELEKRKQAHRMKDDSNRLYLVKDYQTLISGKLILPETISHQIEKHTGETIFISIWVPIEK